ncbi:MAG: response regulator [Candidatus Contendobacter sp.]|nr:response regulator [Candidatus Contendobacter sp.]MDG4559609.1 response regulator [Candidatus Contendobacter sp.]
MSVLKTLKGTAMWQEDRSPFFDNLVRELRGLCQEKHSGTLFITTQENHAARFVIQDGVIIGITYRSKHGADAIPLIKNITGGHYTFAGRSVFLSSSESTVTSLPTTPEILRLLSGEPEIPANPVSARPMVASMTTEPVAKPVDSVFSQPSAFPATAVPVVRPVKGNPLTSGKKILVVEDSDVTRKLIAKILIQSGYAVVEAEDGLAAFARLNEESPDLILLDIVMPGIDGYKVLSMVRKHEKFKNLPVIMMTSKVSLLDRLRGKMDGSIEYLAKPFSSSQLLEKLTGFFHQTSKMPYALAI